MNRDIDHHNSAESGSQNFVTEEMVFYPARLLQLKMSAKHYHQRYLKQNGTYLTELRKTTNDEISKHPLCKNTFQNIKGAAGSGLKALKRKVRGPTGQKAGTYTTNAHEIDQILIDAWRTV